MRTSLPITLFVCAAMMTTACDKKMTFSPADNLDGLSLGEDDGNNGGGSTPGESDGIPDPSNPADPDNPPPGCTTSYEEVTTPVKILFLVDKSGSNKDDANTAAVNDGTDPNKSWRINSMNNLRSNLPMNLFSFNITLFRGNYSNINDGNRYGGAGGDTTLSLINGFSNDAATVNAAMSSLAADADKGKTPYPTALAKARDIIAADIASDTVSKYSVIMVTDGHPDPNLVTKTDCGGVTCDRYNGSHADIPASIEKAKELVKEIVDISPSRINVNTVYYFSAGQRKTTPVTILSNMAEAGNGAFIEAASNETIDFKNIIRVPDGTTCP